MVVVKAYNKLNIHDMSSIILASISLSLHAGLESIGMYSEG